MNRPPEQLEIKKDCPENAVDPVQNHSQQKPVEVEGVPSEEANFQQFQEPEDEQMTEDLKCDFHRFQERAQPKKQSDDQDDENSGKQAECAHLQSAEEEHPQIIGQNEEKAPNVVESVELREQIQKQPEDHDEIENKAESTAIIGETEMPRELQPQKIEEIGGKQVPGENINQLQGENINSDVGPNKPQSPSSLPKDDQGKKVQNSALQERHSSEREVPSPTLKSGSVIRQAEKERVGSIYQQFCNYNVSLQKTIGSYKIIIKNVCSQLQNKQESKNNLETTLIDYFEEYSKIHKLFHEKSSKFPKENLQNSVNKFVNIKQDLRRGFEELLYLRKNVGIDAHKLDSYIHNYIIKSIRQFFQTYREEITSEERRQLIQKEEFLKEEKVFKKMVGNLEKICKNGKEGVKSKEDLFVELVAFVNEEVVFREVLIKMGKSTLGLRKGWMMAEKKLFDQLNRLLNEFKNEQKMVYTASKQFNIREDYSSSIESQTTFQRLCTITDVDYIKGVLLLSSKKEKVDFTNKHFQTFLEMPFFEREVGNSRELLKGAMTKSFPLQKKDLLLVHTISQNLVEYNKIKNESLEIYPISKLNAKIFAEGAVEFEVVSGLIFKESKTVRLQFQDGDRAQELISYLNEMQEIKQEKEEK